MKEVYVWSNIAVRSDICILDFSQMVLPLDTLRSQICSCCSQLYIHYRMFLSRLELFLYFFEHLSMHNSLNLSVKYKLTYSACSKTS
jgi:hypothetical protein